MRGVVDGLASRKRAGSLAGSEETTDGHVSKFIALELSEFRERRETVVGSRVRADVFGTRQEYSFVVREGAGLK